MPRTQLKYSNLADHTLTGASFVPEMNFYDETASYVAGDRVVWKGSIYEAKNDVTGTVEGDLSNTPDTSVDWEIVNSALFGSYASVQQTFAGTATTYAIDTGIYTDSINRIELDSANNAVKFNSNGNFFINFTLTFDNTTTTRTVTYAWLQRSTDGGSTWTDVEHSKAWSYNRTSGEGYDTLTAIIPVNVNSDDLFRVQMQNKDNINVQTITDSCYVYVFNTLATSGPKGDKGDTGQPGDIIWTGDWDSTRTYNENEAVYYNGSSYVSIANSNTETPSETATNWDLLAKKGDTGTGASITIQDDGTDLPNTPHNTIDFIGGSLEATDAGSGVAQVRVKRYYRTFIWAEENAGLGAGNYEWAFGNGANTPSNRGPAVHVPSGWTCKAVALSLTLNAGSATVALSVNGSDVATVSCDTATSQSAVTDINVNIANNDRINFHTNSASGTSAPNVVGVWLEFEEN